MMLDFHRRQTSTTKARFEALFREHYAIVLAYARRRVEGELVDDVVAETFLVAWRRLDDVPPDARPWLIAVARNVLATSGAACAGGSRCARG